MTRPTRTEPTFSGVIGLIANALGRMRADDVSDLAQLRFGVRCDRPGDVIRDFHTAGAGPHRRTSPEFPGGVRQADDRIPSDHNKRLVPTHRYLLSGAAFLCGLEGETELLRSIAAGLKRPARPLFLGRKANPPSAPIWLADGLRTDTGLLDALAEYPLGGLKDSAPSSLRLLVTASQDEPWDHMVRDIPIGPAFVARTFAPRRVRTLYLTVTPTPPFPITNPHDPLDVWIPGDIVA